MVTFANVTYFFVVYLVIIVKILAAESIGNVPRKLITGFTATPNPTVTNFQPVLADSTGNFSLSFLRVNQDQLALAIVHVPSGESLWQANSGEMSPWGKHTQLFFNGSLVIMAPRVGVVWSSNTNGDHVILGSDTNLQILEGENSRTLWQSFDFPTNTLVETQNFTSAMSLVSSNGLYSMRLGFDFIGLYANLKNSGSGLSQIYYRHRALKVKANIVPGHGPVVVRISSDGFMGMYQNSSVPADIQSFSSYQRVVPGPRRIQIESDGNLKGYYWSGSSWIIDYVAISEPCELPNPCGPYGLCTPGDGCSCLDNQTGTQTQTQIEECHPTYSGTGDVCNMKAKKYTELRRTGVELPFKELMPVTQTTSYEDCEKSCVNNCTCWGALYNNASRFCYYVDYPIQTIIGVGDITKMGYFKVWENVEKKKDKWLGIGIGLLCGTIISLLGVVFLARYKLGDRNRNVKNRFLEAEEIVSSGSYKDLGSSSFRSIELTNK